MKGQCYCGKIQYQADAESASAMACHCRECRYYTGGGANYIQVVPTDKFKVTQGEPKFFQRTDIEQPVKRFFCQDCGTPIASEIESIGMMAIKAGTADDHQDFAPQVAIWTCEKLDIHQLAEGLPAFEKLPG